ncbi:MULTISPECIES: flagellar biosynthetic protein FliR [Alteromonadaceae]|uniref:flagellar biosynthetic protein FliR n=1 Tax=Alteromonadaceae TaxID=72275 RepID=UPI001C090675|nr:MULTISPECIES: flagellar biosynthetic protein FliR [Aliiglaciecola]MBU2878031.1 flagellar type III secretion system protein FliR [Aliiglaciecola lipolytica]MDO6709396.1 flagellar biosynthetic protein FliR [Aliiglaciecola sp. 2_MG-2023]MDO6750544.1 flagellar biosynthetic protein FliR [Aliiglaciecola sp. 1_MG-2023]
MEFAASTITDYMADMLLPFMRISGLFAAMVGISAKTVPTPIRTLLTLFLTLLIMPVVPPVDISEIFSVSTFVLIIQQLIIGLAIGFISAMMLDTFVIAGQVVAMQTGLGFASIVDPVNGINVPAVGQFYLILATLLFWALDGHLAMISMVVMSFEAFPIGEAWFQPEQFREIAHWASWMFVAAVTLSLAPIVSLLLVNLAFGVMTKAAPQLNIFSIGFAIAQIMGLLIIWLTMDNFTHHFELQWQRAQQLMCNLLQVCAN